jgi:enoyl-CoA hydratase
MTTAHADALVAVEYDGAVATIRLNRPPVNALNRELRAGLARAARAVSEARDVRAVIVTGAEKAFAAGADITELAAASLADMTSAIRDIQDYLGVLASVPKPTVAAISGFALGGGLEIALAADWRIASEDARLGLPEVTLGIIPGGGGTQRLTRLIGVSRAKELLMTGRRVRAEEALRIGLVDEVVPAGQAYTAAARWARQFETAAPLAVAAAKSAADRAAETDLESGLRLEQALFLSVFASGDARAGLNSFLENGPGRASFTGA